ncbi:MAG: SPFH domain-containing protein [Propionibacterium sp.]|jgi:regulator of protease activity HflC (stomatin/prohibitin superfamily)|uniref:SPFH domain-containing protein n=1 Tax=Brooklawnia propionicigenes TaxID=3041175 RepID=A0AAN0KE25_9ACTN|nr:SPFH domain-containing protein [Brooklawnia sp. SH051]MEA5121064.1 SPFH domain-containing protein [Propionibacterium sp.]NLI86612.1 SPFH domain-containing protein [Propionibacterium sp.]BEH00848.1 SPFH domain-containing protein [Brooklawnia sp. SH051]
MPDETRDVVEEASVGGEAAGKPVGHEGTRVMVDERPAWTMSGALALLLALALLGLSTWGIIATAISDDAGLGVNGLLIFGCIVGYLLAFLMFTSLTIVAPGDTKVVQFFGRYIGSIRKQGLLLTIPLSSKKRVSVKVRNFETNELKVNDADGNPINIAAIVVWQVADTAKSVFAVEAYEDFVKVQAESALRHIATSHPYDFAEPGEESLRGSTDLVSGELAEEVAARIAIAGLEVVETRISSLAYAAEIAQAMLQRQQASAVLAARSKIVEGAVGMVEQALERLETDDIVSLDDERKAAMVSNLLVVLCSDSRSTPVINTGTLYG